MIEWFMIIIYLNSFIPLKSLIHIYSFHLVPCHLTIFKKFVLSFLTWNSLTRNSSWWRSPWSSSKNIFFPTDILTDHFYLTFLFFCVFPHLHLFIHFIWSLWICIAHLLHLLHLRCLVLDGFGFCLFFSFFDLVDDWSLMSCYKQRFYCRLEH